MSSLSAIRTEITALDYQLLTLLARRRELSLAAAQAKAKVGLPIRDVVREEELLNALIQKGAALGLEPELLRELYRIIISDSVALQERHLG